MPNTIGYAENEKNIQIYKTEIDEGTETPTRKKSTLMIEYCFLVHVLCVCPLYDVCYGKTLLEKSVSKQNIKRKAIKVKVRHIHRRCIRNVLGNVSREG